MIHPDLSGRPNVDQDTVGNVFGDHVQIAKDDVVAGTVVHGAIGVVGAELRVIDSVLAVRADDGLVVPNAGVGFFLHVNVCGNDNGLRANGIQLLFQLVSGGDKDCFAQYAADGTRFFVSAGKGIGSKALQPEQVQLPLLCAVAGVGCQPDGVVPLIVGEGSTGGNAGDPVVEVVSLEVLLDALNAPVLRGVGCPVRHGAGGSARRQILAVCDADDLIDTGGNIVDAPVLRGRAGRFLGVDGTSRAVEVAVGGVCTEVHCLYRIGRGVCCRSCRQSKGQLRQQSDKQCEYGQTYRDKMSFSVFQFRFLLVAFVEYVYSLSQNQNDFNQL